MLGDLICAATVCMADHFAASPLYGVLEYLTQKPVRTR